MTTTPVAAPMVCPVCGTPTVAGARFCYSCGAMLDTVGDVRRHRPPSAASSRCCSATSRTSPRGRRTSIRSGSASSSTTCSPCSSKAVTDCGGTVDKLTGDGIMAVFGAPTAHEDDTERAVRAAAQMQAAVRRLMAEETGGGRRMGLRVGLNTGEVLAGVQASLAYTVVGDTVNTASRLSDAASIGAVYAGRATALATMSIASWRALPPLRLKGKREPVPAYELMGIRPPGAARLGLGEEAPFIGRDAEFGRLVGRVLDVVERGKPASVVVTGEAGVGKTRLAVELARFAGELPGRPGAVGSLPAVRREPRDVGARRVDAHRVRHHRGGRRRGRDRAGHAGRWRGSATLSQAGRSTSPPPTGCSRCSGWSSGRRSARATPRRRVPAELLRDPTVEAVVAVLAALVAEGPLVLVVDDAQWATGDLLRRGDPPRQRGARRGAVRDGRSLGPAHRDLVGPDARRRGAAGRAARRAPRASGCCAPTSAARSSTRRPATCCSTAPRATRSSSPRCCTCSSTAACCAATATAGGSPASCLAMCCRPGCRRCWPPASTG